MSASESRNLRAIVCCISGEIPEEPVVSRKTGHVYERRLILRALEASDGVCPETQERLTADDLIELKPNGQVVERQNYTEGDGGVDGILDLFRSKWDLLKLELHQAKIALLDCKKELATSMYRCEVAERTVGRLRTEKDKCEEDIKKLKDEMDKARMNGERQDELRLWPENLLRKAEDREYDLRTSRKAKVIPQEHATVAAVSSFEETGSLLIGGAAATSLVMAAEGDFYTGMTNGKVGKIEVWETGMRLGRIVEHGEGEVVRVMWDDAGKRILSGGDSMVKVWDEEREVACLREETAVLDFGVHAVEGILFVVLEDGKWVWRDLGLSGSIVCRGRGGTSTVCGGLHPDGLVFGLGRADGVVELWDARRMEKVLELGEKGGSVREMRMSEKGYYIATAAGDEMRLFDLRKETRLCGKFEMNSEILGMDLDGVGEWGCTVARDSVKLFSARKRAKVVSQISLRCDFPSSPMKRTGCVWGKDAKFVLVGGGEGLIYRFSGGVP